MPSDYFATLGRSARASIPVPDAPVKTIRDRARTKVTQYRARSLVVLGALCVLVLGAGVRFAGAIYSGIHLVITVDLSKAGAIVGSGAFVRDPLATDVHLVASRAVFPVVFPVGLPSGSRVNWIAYAPLQHPTLVDVGYQVGRSRRVGFVLVDSKSVRTVSRTLPAGLIPPMQAVSGWRVGKEIVIISKRAFLSVKTIDRIKKGMMNASPASSLAATLRMLSKVTVVGGNITPSIAAIAQRYAPLDSTAVLLLRNKVDRISMLARRHNPVIDDRTVYVTNIPSSHGVEHSITLHWKRNIAIPASGVVAIESVLRNASPSTGCKCDILFDQPNASTYWVWTIQIVPPNAVRKYVVNAKTLAVTPPT
jgi:hypothetical protein